MLEELGCVVISFQNVHCFRTSVPTVQRCKNAEGSQCCFVSTHTPNKCLVSKRAISEVSELKKGVSILVLVVTVEESS